MSLDGEPIVAAGGGEGGGDAGGGGVAVADAPEQVIPGAEGAPEGGAEGGPPEPADPDAPPAGEEQPEPDQAALEQDARIVDVKTRQQIAELRKTNPALAKVASDAIFGRQAVMKEFPEAKNLGDALKSIRAINQTLEAVGGEEGITKLQGDVESYEKEIGQFSNGDPELVAELKQGNPEGFVKTVSNALGLLARENPEPGDLFDQATTPMFNTRIQKAGLPSVVAQIMEAATAGDGQKCFDLCKNVQKWLADVDGYAKSLGEGKSAAADPKEQALTAREQKIANEEKASYDGKVAADVNGLNNNALKPMLESLFKKLDLKEGGRKKFTDLVQSNVWAAMKADKVFQRNAKAIKARGDVAATAKFVNAKFVELLSGPDGIFTQTRNEMYPHFATAPKPKVSPAGTKPVAAGGKPAVAPVKLAPNARPLHKDVNWGETSDIDWIRGHATLVDGKRIKFDPNSPPNKL